METPCTKVYSMATSHWPFFSRPAELTDILHDIAQKLTDGREMAISSLVKKE